MRNFWFLTLLVASSLLFVWCNPTSDPEVIDDCIIPEECSDGNTEQEFIAYYDNWNIRIKWNYINWMKEWVWTEYDEGWNVINLEEYHEWELIEDGEESYNYLTDENLFTIYPEIRDNFSWSVILWDVLQSNYLSWSPIIYYDPYQGIALKLWEEFDWWLIREIDSDEDWYPHHEIIFLVKGEENEENRTWINWFKEIFAITAISKQILEDFKATPEFNDKIIGENNAYYFISDSDNSHYSNLIVFDINE